MRVWSDPEKETMDREDNHDAIPRELPYTYTLARRSRQCLSCPIRWSTSHHSARKKRDQKVILGLRVATNIRSMVSITERPKQTLTLKRYQNMGGSQTFLCVMDAQAIMQYESRAGHLPLHQPPYSCAIILPTRYMDSLAEEDTQFD